MSLNINSWPWKIAIVLALIGMREFVRLVSPKETSGQTAEGGKWLIETLDSAAIAIGLVLFVIQPFLLQAFFIPSGSMEDTLRISDRLLVSKLIYRLSDPHFQDVVVFKAPPEALINSPTTEPDPDFIKRCIGTPGDVVWATNRHYYRNGVLIADSSGHEPYVKWSNSGNLSYSYDMKIVDGKVYSREFQAPNVPGPWMLNEVPVSAEDQENITLATPGSVPPDRFLMLGDHRNDSNDGHVWGFVPRANVIGKAVCVFWPPTRVGLVDRMSFFPRPPEVEPVVPVLQP